MARVIVAMYRWRIPLVPREADELPFPTDMDVCGFSTLVGDAVTSDQNDI